MDSKTWWQRPLRVVQTNLQVKDTARMNPIRIAQEVRDMEANVLVFNAGGIYAWYDSAIRFHHVNEYLNPDTDLFGDMVDACHKLGIRVVARFDFSKADDAVYQQRPWWFAKDIQGEPYICGGDRMGEWPLLLTTCLNAGYRDADFAVPVIGEALERYAIDGIFLNATNYRECHCEACRTKYMDTYGEPLPDSADEFQEDWAGICTRDNMNAMHAAIRQTGRDVPLILYYFHNDLLHFAVNHMARDDDGILTCAESQNVLSLGVGNLSPTWTPALSMKTGRNAVGGTKPLGIIHTCPGMDWRHTGMPSAEHRFWMSQIPANGGQIWHSLTGFGDTITDKRILRNTTEMNRKIKLTEELMEDAEPVAEVLLLTGRAARGSGWIEAMFQTQILFEISIDGRIAPDRLREFAVVVIPDGFDLSPDLVGMLSEYVSAGGCVIVENSSVDALARIGDFAGMRRCMASSGSLAASYLRLEETCDALRVGLEETELIPHRGVVAYCEPEDGNRVLATLVPPFAPLDAVGAPPERASIPTPRTDIPLVTMKNTGEGRVICIPFQIGMLVDTYRLADHYRLLRNIFGIAIGSTRLVDMEPVPDLQVSLFRKGDALLIHFVNSMGSRPLTGHTPRGPVKFTVNLPNDRNAVSVRSCIEGGRVEFSRQGNVLECELEKLDVWDMVAVDTEPKDQQTD